LHLFTFIYIYLYKGVYIDTEIIIIDAINNEKEEEDAGTED